VALRTEELMLNMGPQHPSTHGVLRLITTLNGENIVDVQFAIQYTLKSPEDYLFNNKNPDDNVLQAAETSIREIVGKSRMDFVLNQGRSEIAARVKVLMQQILDRIARQAQLRKRDQRGVLGRRTPRQLERPLRIDQWLGDLDARHGGRYAHVAVAIERAECPIHGGRSIASCGWRPAWRHSSGCWGVASSGPWTA